MSGTKYDQDKAPLIYNYWDGICEYTGADQWASVVTDLLRIKSLLDVDKTEEAVDKCCDAVSNEIKRLNLSVSSIILEVSKVCKMGADKYGHYNYQSGIHYDRLLSAALRHRTLGPDFVDSESGLPHRAHFFSNLFMLIELIKLGKYK